MGVSASGRSLKEKTQFSGHEFACFERARTRLRVFVLLLNETVRSLEFLTYRYLRHWVRFHHQELAK